MFVTVLVFFFKPFLFLLSVVYIFSHSLSLSSSYSFQDMYNLSSMFCCFVVVISLLLLLLRLLLFVPFSSSSPSPLLQTPATRFVRGKTRTDAFSSFDIRCIYDCASVYVTRDPSLLLRTPRPRRTRTRKMHEFHVLIMRGCLFWFGFLRSLLSIFLVYFCLSDGLVHIDCLINEEQCEIQRRLTFESQRSYLN